METNPEKASAIKSAISAEDIAGLIKLLKEIGQKNPVIDYFESEPISVLHSIASEGKLLMFRTISNTLTDLQPRSQGFKGATPLHYAGEQGHRPIVRFITNCIKDINPPDSIGQSVMQYAAKKGHLDVIKLYVDELRKNTLDINPSDEDRLGFRFFDACAI